MIDSATWRNRLTGTRTHSDSKGRRANVSIQGVVILVIALFVISILAGSVFIQGVGSFANATQGNACKNCDATTKSLLPNINIFLVIALMLVIIGIAIASFRFGKH